MPTFTPIALDHLLEPRSHTQPHKAAPKPPQPQPPAKVTDGPIPVPAHPIAANRSQASLVLYTTPESTPVQDSPSSYPPSPYIINHKRRGPCLLKTLSQGDVGSKDPTLPLLPPQPAPPKKSQCLEVQQSEFAFQPGSSLKESCLSNGTNEGYGAVEKTLNENNGILPNVRDTGESEWEEPEFEFQHGSTENLVRPVNVGTPGNSEYFDIQDSLSIASNTDADDTGGIERMLKPSTPVAEFYDAFDEISSDGATRSSRCIDDELREMRLSLLMEIERRKQAEEAFENLQNEWKRLSHHLSLVALTLPPPAAPERTGDSGMDYGTELCQQITVSRFVAAAVASGLARSEVESQMEPLVAAKNFEIARLSDRVQYYEAANREMSQRNQEAIEMARQERNKRKKRQKWFWGSVGLAVTLGAAAIAWSYLPSSSQPAASQGSNGTDSN